MMRRNASRCDSNTRKTSGQQGIGEDFAMHGGKKKSASLAGRKM